MKILITGFDPFGGEDTNPSEDVLRMLPEIPGEIAISAGTGEGVDVLRRELESRLTAQVRADSALVMRRHIELAQQALVPELLELAQQVLLASQELALLELAEQEQELQHCS